MTSGWPRSNRGLALGCHQDCGFKDLIERKGCKPPAIIGSNSGLYSSLGPAGSLIPLWAVQHLCPSSQQENRLSNHLGMMMEASPV